jgi:C4-dicarboxylate transporter DctQ subunit
MEHSILGRINAVIYRVIKEILIAIGLVLIALVFIGAVLRYIFGLSIIWSYEVSILLLVWSAFLGAAAGVRSRNHVNFDLFMNKLPPSARKWAVLLKDLIVIAFLVTGTWYGYKVLGRTMRQQMQTINLPVGLLYMAIPVGFVPMILFYLQELFENFAAKPASAVAKTGGEG